MNPIVVLTAFLALAAAIPPKVTNTYKKIVNPLPGDDYFSNGPIIGSIGGAVPIASGFPGGINSGVNTGRTEWSRQWNDRTNEWVNTGRRTGFVGAISGQIRSRFAGLENEAGAGIPSNSGFNSASWTGPAIHPQPINPVVAPVYPKGNIFDDGVIASDARRLSAAAISGSRFAGQGAGEIGITGRISSGFGRTITGSNNGGIDREWAIQQRNQKRFAQEAEARRAAVLNAGGQGGSKRIY